LSISGSFAGAMGPAQFIPSSFWIFGGDADGDGLASPFNLSDAKFSMGRYLKKFGWREDASDEEKRKALWYYNRSSVYVNTVMMVYETLALQTEE
jgi:membrane-bound lytic murein transglycosylase B